MGVRLMTLSHAPWVTSLLLLAGGAIAQPSFAASDAKKVTLHIAPQPVGDALNEFGRQTGLTVMIQSAVAHGVMSPQLNGEFTPIDALNQILAHTGLRYEYLDSKTVAVLGSHVTPSDPTLHTASVGEGNRAVSAEAADASSSDDDQYTRSQSTDRDGETTYDKTKKIEEVVITGSNIRGAAPVGAPIVTINSAQIAESGYTTTQQIIESLPENFRGGAAGASSDTNFSAGANHGFNTSFGSGINLRGLGNTATLILVNGHRVASSGSGYFTDISTIPISAIDHIDVLTDGASAIYGSDAIAGVVNVVLRGDSQGLDVGARYGNADGFSSEGGTLQIGHRWGSGGATLDADFSHQNTLDSADRTFTSDVLSPTSIAPSFTQTALSAAAHQGFGDLFEIHGDAQYTSSLKTGFNSAGDPAIRQKPRVDRWSGSFGGSYQISNSWSVRYDVSGGVGVEDLTIDNVTGTTPVSFNDRIKETLRFSDQNATASGDVFTLPAGAMKLAIGGSYRTEGYTHNEQAASSPAFSSRAHRNTSAGFGELQIPVFSEMNAIPGVSKLTLSAAVRHDHYSDFGDSTNPKYGISWFPINTLELRGAYSTSFRAPATGQELYVSQKGTTAVVLFADPGPGQTDMVPVVALAGGQPKLQPETARNLSFGLEYKPLVVPGLRLSLSYYDITYSGQIAVPAFSINPLNSPALAPIVTRYPDPTALQALVNAAVNSGASLYDFTGGLFGSNPLSTAVFLYNDRSQNLSRTKTSGFDVVADYPFSIHGDLVDVRVNATRIDKFSAQVTAGSPPISEVNTVGYPARLRLRAQTVWTHGGLNASIAANYVGSYPDTSAATSRDVGDFTTIDLVARYNFQPSAPAFLHGMFVSIAGINMLNRRPPFVEDGTLGFTPGSHYDPANADPFGRLITISLMKHW